MSRKHYIAIAKDFANAVNAAKTSGEINILRELAQNIASTLQQDNGAFDRTRFLNACGV